MKKNLKVVQINGFRGLILLFFIISCLIAGFIAFPAFLSMNLWNYLAEKTGSFPIINFFAGVLLWAIIAFSLFLFSKRKFIVSFKSKHELSSEELDEVFSKIKTQDSNKNIVIPKEFTEFSSKEDNEEIKEIQTSSEEK